MPRKLEFDPEEALIKATNFFWKNGFENTSIRGLIESTGVNFYGLYSVLGDKKRIYLKSLDLYIEEYLRILKSLPIETGSLAIGVKKILEHIYEKLQSKNKNSGCMICNAAIETSTREIEIDLRIQRHRKAIESYLSEFVIYQKRPETLKPESVQRCSEYLCTQVYSLALLIKSGASDSMIRRHIDSTSMIVTELIC